MPTVAETSNAVGLGVDLIGGAETLAQLRAIRAEMTAINALSGRTGGSSSSGSAGSARQTQLKTEEQLTNDHLNRMRNLRIQSERAISEQEIQIAANTANRREQLAARVTEHRQAQARAERAILEQQARDQETFLAQGQARIERFNRRQAERQQRHLAYTQPPVPEATTPTFDEDSYLARLRRQAATGRRGALQQTEGGRPIFTVDGVRGTLDDRNNIVPIGGRRAPIDRGGRPPGGGDDEDGAGGGFRGLGRGFLAYEIITRTGRALKDYTEEAIKAAQKTSDYSNALTFATIAAGGNLAANRALADQLGQYGYNRIEGLNVVATAARATFRHPEQTRALAQVAADLAASRGGGLEATPEVIEDIIGGRDRKYREYFNITPEEIYKADARKKIAAQTQFPDNRVVGRGPGDYDTDAQKVNKYVAALTEEEKEQLRLNYVLSQSFRFQGDAADRAATLAGKIDLVSASFANAKANVGGFIAELGPIKDAIDGLNSPSAGSIFRPSELGRTGPQNTVTNKDITQYVEDQNLVGNRATALNIFSRLGRTGSNLITFLATGGLSGAVRGIDNIANPERTDAQQLQYDVDVTTNRGLQQQQKRLAELRAENKLGYRPKDFGPNATYSTYGELRAQGLSAGDILRNYQEDIRPQPEKFDDSKSEADLDKYREEALKREDERKRKNQADRERNISEISNALGKLRSAQQGSFRLPYDIGAARTGEDNPYTKVLADQVTIAERMRQQWGFLGKAAVDYFTKLEQGANNRALNKLEYQTYTSASTLRGQVDRETAERNGPGLSRREQEYLNIQEAIVNKATQIPQLWRQAAAIIGLDAAAFGRPNPTGNPLRGSLNLITQAFGFGRVPQYNDYGQNIAPDNTLRNAFGQSLGNQFELGRPRTNIYGQSLEDPKVAQIFRSIGAGQSPEVKNAIQKSFASTLLEAFKGYSPSQIRQAGLQDVFLGALRLSSGSLQNDIEEARKKAQFGAESDSRLSKQLKDDEAFRQAQLAKGYDAREVGRASDELQISRTNGISPKDLTFEQFKNREDALRRQADRDEQQRQEAQVAVAEGLTYQATMTVLLAEIRNALIGGSASMLVQVQNDTQAHIDQNALETLQGVGPLVTKTIQLNQDAVKSNPYTPSLDRYGRGGRKR